MSVHEPLQYPPTASYWNWRLLYKRWEKIFEMRKNVLASVIMILKLINLVEIYGMDSEKRISGGKKKKNTKPKFLFYRVLDYETFFQQLL